MCDVTDGLCMTVARPSNHGYMFVERQTPVEDDTHDQIRHGNARVVEWRVSRGQSRVGLGSLFQNPTQPKISGPKPTHKSLYPTQPNPTQPIVDTWYGILGYTENFIQQLLHVTDKFTVRS